MTTEAPNPAATSPAVGAANSAPDAPPAPTSYVDRALARMTAPPAEAPAPTVAPEPPTPSVADMVIDGTPMPSAEPAQPATDPSLAMIVDLEQRARADRAAFEEERRAFAAQQAEVQAYLAAKKATEGGDPLAALKALGLSYEDLTAYMINGGGALPPATEQVAQLQAQMAEMQETFTKQLEERDVAAKAAREAQESASRDAWKAKTNAQVSGDKERWGLLSDPVVTQGRPAADVLYETMERHYLQTGGDKGGEMLSVEQAADMLEAAYERRLREGSTGSKLARILGVTGAPAPAPAPIAPSHSPAETSSSGPAQPSGLAAPSLTNALAAERGTPERKFDAASCRARAIERARSIKR